MPRNSLYQAARYIFMFTKSVGYPFLFSAAGSIHRHFERRAAGLDLVVDSIQYSLCSLQISFPAATHYNQGEQGQNLSDSRAAAQRHLGF
ncbi:hypothetical protein AVEN_34168-1 [Araneus ventricosus]|uniref:Uncharacterized protein n=1 Tax=Araneus ventricosus TaxID=182803 RepID=A0A4Y2PAP1_ARAVE|nr:hypothetical protein AVEN_34168-1 [Araneus ventricosus]